MKCKVPTVILSVASRISNDIGEVEDNGAMTSRALELETRGEQLAELSVQEPKSTGIGYYPALHTNTPLSYACLPTYHAPQDLLDQFTFVHPTNSEFYPESEDQPPLRPWGSSSYNATPWDEFMY